MKVIYLSSICVLPVSAQFLVPIWRAGDDSSHAEWDQFAHAKIEKNFPDVVMDADASLISSTTSAFITTSGNIYSFQTPIAMQLDDTTGLHVKNVFLQLGALGSGIDVEGARLLMFNEEGETLVLFPAQTFVASEEELTGEMGGIGTTYGIQWDLRETPLTGSYTILFGAASTSLSLDRVSLDLSETYEKVAKPEPLSVQVSGDEVLVSWFGGRQLQASHSLDTGWADVLGADGVNQITLPITGKPRFFRLKQLPVPEE